MEPVHSRQQETFRLDLEGQRFWRGPQALRLRPKSFAVLRTLVTQLSRLVLKQVVDKN